MTSKTLEFIIRIAGVTIEVIITLMDKMNGRKRNDDKGDAKKK